MPFVRFTRHLQRYFPDLSDGPVEAGTVAELVSALEQRHPGLAFYLVDEHGALRRHVNVFVSGEMVVDRERLRDRLRPDDEVFVVQALSGG